MALKNNTGPGYGLPVKKNTAAGAMSNMPCSVFVEVRNRDGQRLGIEKMAYDGSPADAIKKAVLLDKAVADRYQDWSGIQSRWGATDSEGMLKYVISPNFRHIAEANTKEARYILGDISAI